MIKSLIFMIIFLLIILSSCEKTEEYFPEASPDYVQKAGVDDLFLSDESRIRGGKTEPEIYVQMGHVSGSFSYTNAVQFIGGGKYFLSGNGDGTIKLWNTLSGREIRTFNCEDDVTNLDISKDGRLLVSGDMSDMKNINLWDISSGKKIKFVNSHMDMSCNGYPVLFCNDDRNIISGGSESTLRLWDIESGEMIRDYKAKADSSVNPDVSAIVLTPDGKSVIAGYRYNAQGVESQDFTIRIWNLETGEEIIAFNKANGWVETLGIKPDGKYLISGDWQQDSVRIWDVETGKQMAAYHTGGTSAIDVSAGGRYALLGGCMGFRLIELSTGKNIRTINKGIEGWVRSIKFSPDGKYALVGDDLSKPMLWDLESGSLVTEYGGYANKLETAKLSKTGNIMLTADDYTDAISIWDYRNGILIKTIARDSSSLMSCATISADGSLMATGGWNGRTSNAIVWDIASSKKIARMELEEESGNHTGFLQITDDNKYLIWATQVKLTISDLRSGKEVAQIADSTHGFRSIFAEPNGNYLLISSYTGGFKMFSVPDGRFIKNISDGKDINYIFGNEYLYEFKSIKNAFGDWQRYLTQYDLKNLEEKSRSKINEFYFNFGIGQSRETLFFCHNFAKDISKYDINKNQVVTAFTGHTRPITNLDLTPDGKFLCSGSIDGTARFWNPETGKEVAQFIAFKGGEWIVITPKGYFNASPNGAKYLNVRVGNQVYSIDNFHEKYFNPAYVASVLQGKRIEATDDIREGVAPPPEIRFASPQPNMEFDSEEITVTVSAKDMGGGIDEIRLYHNDKAVGEETRGMKVKSAGKEQTEPAATPEITKSYTLSLVNGDNAFRAVGYSKDRTESNPVEIMVRMTGGSKNVSMYVFTVGVNNYENPALNLNYAQPDAKGIADFFRQSGKGLFKSINITDIYNDQATKAGILAGLGRLKNTQPQDAVLIFLAGHGENIEDKWYFIPHELRYPEREEDVKTKGISSDELSGHIRNIRAQKILVLIDACKSGAALVAFRGFEDRKALAQLSRATGVHVVAASNKDQFASEVKELGHGVFTYTLLEGLKGKAVSGGEAITVRKLMSYVEEELPELTKKYRQEAQFPVVDSKGMDFPLVINK